MASLLVYVSRCAPSTVSARKATIVSAFTSGSVYAIVLASTYESVSPRAESGVLTFISASVSPGFSACISASVSATELNSASVMMAASVLLIVWNSFSGSVYVCRQHSWPVLKKRCKPWDESVQNCQLPLRQVPQAPRSTILFRTTCGRVAKSVSSTAWASTLLSVLPAHLASISATVGSSVMTRDSAFRKLSVWPTFPAFTSASLLTNASFSILRIVWPGFCKAVMQRVNEGIKFQITHFSRQH